jgi:CRP-like cAMP-binding protein
VPPNLVLRDFHAIGITRPHESHSVLIREGSPADHLLIVCSGRVKVIASSAEGRLLLLRVAGPGDFLGLAALLQATRYRVSAESLEPCVIKSIPRSDFIRFMTKSPSVGQLIAHALAREYNGAVLPLAASLSIPPPLANLPAPSSTSLARTNPVTAPSTPISPYPSSCGSRTKSLAAWPASPAKPSAASSPAFDAKANSTRSTTE